MKTGLAKEMQALKADTEMAKETEETSKIEEA